MDNLEYDYNVDDTINLDDYDFEEYDEENNETLQNNLKPTPSILKYSTRTVNLSIFPVFDYEKRIDYIHKLILPPLFKKYEINVKFPEDILKKIILYRIIKDSIPYDVYFDALCAKLVNEPLTIELIMFKIENTQSRFIDVKFLYDNVPLDKNYVNTVLMRDYPLKTVIDYHNRKRGFRNQVTFRMLSEDKQRTINIMIFQNGRMTFTGCRTNDDVIYIYTWIKNLIETLSVNNKRAIHEKYEKIYIADIVNQSMNCHYDLKFKLDNNLLYYLLLDEKMFKYVDYKPNKFAGLKLRFREVPGKYKGTVCIFFQSGKINIYRSASEEEIAYIYETVNSLMDKYYLKIRQ